MEILYIYISEHHLFPNQGFNFGGEFLFDYNKESKSLQIMDNPYYLKGFFNQNSVEQGAANVLNVTGIIAENGAGKTTLLNIIRDNFPTGKGGLNFPMIIVYIVDGKKHICHFKEIPISNEDHIKLGFIVETIDFDRKVVESENPDVSNFNYTTPPKVDFFNFTEFIYFSNIFDGQYHIATKGMHDISTNQLIKKDLEDDILNKRINSEYTHSEVEAYLYNDIERQISYINSVEHSAKLPIRLPQYLNIGTRRDYNNLLYCFDATDKQTLEEFGLIKIVRDFFAKAHEEELLTADWKAKAELYFIKAAFMNFVYELATNNKGDRFKVKFVFQGDDFLVGLNFSISTRNFIQLIENQARNFGFEMPERFFEDTKGVKEFITAIPRFIGEDNVINGEGTSFYINIQKEPEKFREFHALYQRAFILKPFLKFEWWRMSSGEIAFLNTFSRFFSLIERQQRFSNATLARHLIILIDEADSYLHPSWQKKFLKEMLDHLPELLAPAQGEQRTIQLIFTTNSPIPASDLPNSNIIFLEKNGDKAVVKNSLEDKKMTFAANINLLLSDSFFLKDGAIGDFAKLKINHIIDILQKSPSAIEKEKEYLVTVINFIGEPIVKAKLLQMLSDRLTLNLIGMKERLVKLEEEIEKLKKNSNNS